MANFLSIPVADTVDSGTTSETTEDKLVEAGQNFETTVSVGDIVLNTTDTTYATVTEVDSDTTLSLSADIMAESETYVIYSGTVSAERLISARNMMITTQADTNNVTVVYRSGASTDIVTIQHYTQASGYAMRDVLQDGFVAAHEHGSLPYVAIQLAPTQVVLGVTIA
jgi:hypothetical protein